MEVGVFTWGEGEVALYAAWITPFMLVYCELIGRLFVDIACYCSKVKTCNEVKTEAAMLLRYRVPLLMLRIYRRKIPFEHRVHSKLLG